LSKLISQAAVARMKRPEFILFSAAALGLIVWFYAILPESLRDADQIINTAILLGMLGLYLIYDFRPQLAPGSQKARGSAVWAVSGLILAVSTMLVPSAIWGVFSLFVAVCCLLRATGGVLLDKSSQRLLNSLFIAFTLFGALLVSLPLLDMPLRIITGKWSAQIFDWLQNDTELGFITKDGMPMLLLVVNGRPFHVAAECNGFGLLGTCVLFTAAFTLYRKVPILDTFLLLLAAVFLAVVGNLLRIFIIISLAPRVGDHYMLMHEIVGTIAFYGFLGLLLWLIFGFGRDARPTSPKEAA
jgi:exosortase/archaeosortase family protein